jgi:hypothetical protein
MLHLISQDIKAIARRTLGEIVPGGDVAALAEVIHPNIVRLPPGPHPPLPGRQGLEHWAVPDDLDLARQLGPIPRPPSRPVLADALAQLLSDLHP